MNCHLAVFVQREATSNCDYCYSGPFTYQPPILHVDMTLES